MRFLEKLEKQRKKRRQRFSPAKCVNCDYSAFYGVKILSVKFYVIGF